MVELGEAIGMGSRVTERFGRRAEWTAALWLRLKGYKVIGRRIRTRYGEIDLSARMAAASSSSRSRGGRRPAPPFWRSPRSSNGGSPPPRAIS
jgi:hypothetical protein